LADNKALTVLTSVFTIYALTGDDCKRIFTDKPADPVFDAIVILCFAIFSAELMIFSIGKSDYLWGFYFWLDLISTVTLVLDLSAVAEFLMSLGGNGDDGASDLRGGRTARIGARAGRVVRVLRLVRILKLYKVAVEARRVATKAKRRSFRSSAHGETWQGQEEDDDWDDVSNADQDEDTGSRMESQVGRRLSEVTTRRTICLILAMMLFLPPMSAEIADQTATSPEFGADFVFQAFQDSLVAPAARSSYERALLKYMYYHNWFARADPERFCGVPEACPAAYYGHAFWVGIQGHSASVVDRIASDARLSEVVVASLEGMYRSDGIFNLGTMPAEAKRILQSPWDVNCDWEEHVRRGISLLAEEIPGVVDHRVRCASELRATEALKFTPRLITDEQYDDWHMVFYFDIRPFVRLEATFGLLEILAILAILLVSSILFTQDANRLVVQPVEKMLVRVQEIRDNPICAMGMALEEFKKEQRELARKRMRQRDLKSLFQEACRSTAEPMETVILEKSIIKLGSLLALGFGEAGASIISQNMKGDGTSHVNVMVPGTCVDCIIGVARIGAFTKFIEVLQSKIMTFVNQIAEIVHGVATEFHGAPNQNNGDTFLVIWRLERHFRRDDAVRMTELSVLAFCKILGAVQRSPTVAGYRAHPGLRYRLGADARVHLSFGLHAGWAIEGAVGTEFKINASYLSPNVSIASSMEDSSRLYGVPLVASKQIIKLCTPKMIKKFRLIDHVFVKGSKNSIELYCMDLDYRGVPMDTDNSLWFTWNVKNRFRARQFLDDQKGEKLKADFNVVEEFEKDPNIVLMRRRYTAKFHHLFGAGYQNYAQGEWQVARRMLSVTKTLLGGVEDGPSVELLRFMEGNQFRSPKDWDGIRHLALSVG